MADSVVNEAEETAAANPAAGADRKAGGKENGRRRIPLKYRLFRWAVSLAVLAAVAACAWHEAGESTLQAKFFSTLAGKKVQFVLIVKSNGESNQDQAFWLQPRIEP